MRARCSTYPLWLMEISLHRDNKVAFIIIIIISSSSSNWPLWRHCVRQAWSRGKYKAWKRRHPQSGEPDDGPEGCDDGHASRSSLMTRKGTVSRTSARSRESLVRMRSRSTLSLSDTEEEKVWGFFTVWSGMVCVVKDSCVITSSCF